MIKKDKLKAFTMAEAILTMVILGVIAAIMIANLKPIQYRNEGFKVLKKKIYAEIDNVVSSIHVSCTSGMTLSAIYNDCTAKNPANVHKFGESADTENAIFKKYIKAADEACATTLPTGYSGSFKTKSGACIAFKEGWIFVDVNDAEGPNSTDNVLDRMVIEVVTDGENDGTKKPASLDN